MRAGVAAREAVEVAGAALAVAGVGMRAVVRGVGGDGGVGEVDIIR